MEREIGIQCEICFNHRLQFRFVKRHNKNKRITLHFYCDTCNKKLMVEWGEVLHKFLTNDPVPIKAVHGSGEE